MAGWVGLGLEVSLARKSSIGHLSVIAMVYAFNIRVVFRDRKPGRSSLVRYVIASVAALIAQPVLLEMLAVSVMLPEIANAVAILVFVVLNFTVMRRWAFPSTAFRSGAYITLATCLPQF